MSTLVKSITIPADARIKPYYDTKEIVQDQTEVNFFPATATRKATRDNYVSNPFPGKQTRLVAGLYFEVIKQFIIEDTGNSIDVEAIINAIKDGSVIITTDNDHEEKVRDTLDHFMNFSGTGIAGQTAAAWRNGSADSVSVKTGVLKAPNMRRLANPFFIEPTENIDVKVRFKDGSKFPEDSDWETSTQTPLLLRCTLFVTELEQAAPAPAPASA